MDASQTNAAHQLPYPFDRKWSSGEAFPLACILEAAAPKAGNVHPNSGFRDMHFAHFAASAVAMTSVFSAISSGSRVGDCALQAAQQTKQQVGCNTNLGTILLLAPLACAYREGQSLAQWHSDVHTTLDNLTSQDCRDVYEAIRIAQPGGLGHQSENDVHGEPPEDLLAAMSQASESDAVARQYSSGFEDIFHRLAPSLFEILAHAPSVNDAICRLQLQQLCFEPDSLIARKLGSEAAQQVQDMARRTAEDFERSSETCLHETQAYRRLDEFLRADLNRRNPGTTADLIAATLAVCLLC